MINFLDRRVFQSNSNVHPSRAALVGFSRDSSEPEDFEQMLCHAATGMHFSLCEWMRRSSEETETSCFIKPRSSVRFRWPQPEFKGLKPRCRIRERLLRTTKPQLRVTPRNSGQDEMDRQFERVYAKMRAFTIQDASEIRTCTLFDGGLGNPKDFRFDAASLGNSVYEPGFAGHHHQHRRSSSTA